MNYDIVIFIFALAGFFLALNIWFKKRQAKKLVCFFGSDCEKVVNSQFSQLFGIPLELMGVSYYGLLVIVYGWFLLLAENPGAGLTTGLLAFTTGAVLFSIYLILVQTLAIREWCIWCLTSALFSVIIFIATIIQIDFSLFDILQNYRSWIMTALTISLAVGVGTSTIYTILYIKFIKSLADSGTKQDILKTISQINWLGIITISISGVGLYLSQPDTYNQTDSFLAKIFVLALIVLSSILISIILTPLLINKSEESENDIDDLYNAGIAGCLSLFISWYFLLTLTLLEFDNLISFSELLVYYLLCLAFGLGLSLFISRHLLKP